MITPNQLQEAKQELSNFDLGNFKIPSKINPGEVTDYVVVCIKSKDNRDGTAKIHEAKICYAPVTKWVEMGREKSSGRVTGMFLGMFNKEVILHNPTMPLVIEVKPKAKGLSPTHKGKVKSMVNEGASVEEIATELKQDLDKVKAYAETL